MAHLLQLNIPLTLKTNNMTAVEWLEKRLNIYFNKKMNSSLWKIQEHFKRAKEMEKEQIIDAFDNGCDDENRIGKEYYDDLYSL